MTRPSFKLALAQMRVDPGKKADNLARAQERIREAASAGAQIVLLPEGLSHGWTDPSATKSADEIPGGESFQALAEGAKESSVYVCAGLIERCGDRIFNSAVLIDPRGTLLAHHRKINELEIAHELYARGDRLQVAETKFGRIGLMICADAFVRGQVIGRGLALMGAELILSPCAWAVPPTHDNAAEPYGSLWLKHYSPVAREFKILIAGCSSVGPIEHGAWSGWHCIGSSLVVGPSGEKIIQGPYGREAETILYVDLTLRPASRPIGEPGL